MIFKSLTISFKKRLFLTSIVFLVIFSIVSIQLRLDRMKGNFKKGEELEFLPKPEVVKLMVLGYNQIVADILWLRIIQYTGERVQTEKGWQWFIHTLDIITYLDPQFVYAYQFGGLILSVIASKPLESNSFLLKGMEVDREQWIFPFLIGYNYFDYFKDYKKAAMYIGIASKLKGSPFFLTQFAARLYATAGDPENGIVFLEQMMKSTDDETAKKRLETRLKELIIERDINVLEKCVKVFKDAYGYNPESLKSLLQKGIIKYLPKDPFGGYYYLDKEKQIIKSSYRQKRLRIYEKKK